MKRKIVALSLIINIVLIGIVYNLLNPNERLVGEKQILKEMSTSEREQELDNKITELNSSATEYATYVQSCKAQIASAITERGVNTNETDSIDVVVENIKKLGNNLGDTTGVSTGERTVSAHFLGGSYAHCINGTQLIVPEGATRVVVNLISKSSGNNNFGVTGSSLLSNGQKYFTSIGEHTLVVGTDVAVGDILLFEIHGLVYDSMNGLNAKYSVTIYAD